MKMSTLGELRIIALIVMEGMAIYIVQGSLVVLTENIALNKNAIQTDTEADAVAGRAVDGDRSQTFSDGSCSRTLSDDGSWEVDLGDIYTIGQIDIYNRYDCCSNYLRDLKFYAGTTRETYVLFGSTNGPAAALISLFPIQTVTGRWIKISRKLGQKNPLTMCEVEIFELGLTTTTTTTTSYLTTQSNNVTTQNNEVTTSSNVVTTSNNAETTSHNVVTPSSNGVTNLNNTTEELMDISVTSLLFKGNQQTRAVGQIIRTLSARSKRHCCYICLVSMAADGCKSVNYDKINGQCSLVKSTLMGDNVDENIVMYTPSTG